MSALFNSLAPAHSSSSSSSAAYSPAHPDFVAAFGDTGNDSDDDDDTSPLSYNHHHSNHPLASSSAPPLASASSPDLDASHSLPGGYDFEPQSDPSPPLSRSGGAAGPPSVPTSTRPSLSLNRSSFANRLPRAPSAGADDDADLYGRVTGTGGQHGGGFNWRSLVGRLRGQQHTTGAADEHGGSESHGLLFSQEESDETDGEGRTSYPPSRQDGRNIHLPLPSRPPQFAPPPSSASASAAGASGVSGGAGGGAGRIYGGGQGNDGVFANLAAKPDNPNGLDIIGEGPDKDEVLPTYDDANRDATPAYWETTVITPGGAFGDDDMIVDGLPVGNFFSFAWNLLVSMSFQFVGFLLTYLLHTTHAAKNGSRAGLGITLIQLGFYLKQRTDGLIAAPGDSTGLNGAPGPSSDQAWSWWGGTYDDASPPSPSPTSTGALGSLPTQLSNALGSVLEASDPAATGTAGAQASGMPSLMGQLPPDEQVMLMSEQANEWMAFLMITVGSFLLIGGCLSYWRAVRWARAIRQGQGPGADTEAMIAV